MYKKMNGRNLPSMIITIILCIGIAIAIFWFNGETRDYLLTGDNISGVEADEIEDDKIVRGTIYAILGAYAGDDEGTYYIIPVGEDKFMGLYLDNRYEDRAVEIINDTVDYLNGDRETVSNKRLYTGGVTYAMSSDEARYFHEWFTDSGFLTRSELSSYVIDYTYAVVPFSDWNNSTDIVCYIFELISLVVAIFTFFWMVTCRNVAKVKKKIRENGWNKEEIESDVLSGYCKRNIMIGQKYLLCNSVWRWKLYSMKDVIWAYQYTHKTEHRLYGVIKTGTTVVYSVDMWLRNGKLEGVRVKNPKEAQTILDRFYDNYPHIIVGYSDQLRQIRNNNFAQLVQLSDEKEREHFARQDYISGNASAQEQDEWQNDEPSLKFPM